MRIHPGRAALFLAVWLALRYGAAHAAGLGAALGATLPGAALWALSGRTSVCARYSRAGSVERPAPRDA